LRLHNNALLTPLEEPRALSQEDRNAGVVEDVRVRLGTYPNGPTHWMAESAQGVTIQIYCALIASVLLVLWTGRKPTKRQCEALQLYWMGWATLAELENVFGPQKTK